MKNKKIKKLIQKPLRFHHQDIHEELDELKELVRYAISQMQELQQRVDKLDQNAMLRLSKHDDTEGGSSFSLGPK